MVSELRISIWKRKAQVPKSRTVTTPAGRALCVFLRSCKKATAKQTRGGVSEEMWKRNNCSRSEGMEERDGDCQYSALWVILSTLTLTEEDATLQRRYFKGALWPAV